PNHQQLPINRPKVVVFNYNQAGVGNVGNTQSDINYQPTYEGVTQHVKARHSETPLTWSVQQKAIHKELH
ncbi:catalase, partial [Psychromonas arctica]